MTTVTNMQLSKCQLLLTTVFLFKLQVKLHFTDDALRLIAKKAMAKNTGARGLRALLENILTEAMFEVYYLSEKLQRVCSWTSSSCHHDWKSFCFLSFYLRSDSGNQDWNFKCKCSIGRQGGRWISGCTWMWCKNSSWRWWIGTSSPWNKVKGFYGRFLFFPLLECIPPNLWCFPKSNLKLDWLIN